MVSEISRNQSLEVARKLKRLYKCPLFLVAAGKLNRLLESVSNLAASKIDAPQ